MMELREILNKISRWILKQMEDWIPVVGTDSTYTAAITKKSQKA